jgi:3-hydroxyacyl-[acyl-carrier-protein] dehydratase
MRWFWIDRFESFVRNKRAVTIKNVTFGEEPLQGYLPAYPHYPATLMIEGMAQTGGLLIAEPTAFQNRVVLAKVSKAKFYDPVLPGDQLRLVAELQSMQDAGAIVSGTISVGGELRAELDLWFAFLDERYGSGSLFPPAHFLQLLRGLRLYDVAVDEEGHRIPPPAHFVQAERDWLSPSV